MSRYQDPLPDEDDDDLADLLTLPSPEQLDIRKASIISTDSYTEEKQDFFPLSFKQKDVSVLIDKCTYEG